MSIRSTPWPAGVPCWVDISVPDMDAARTFYSAVLGWDIEEGSDEYGGYAIASVNGSAAAGIGPPMGPGPAAWTLYIASDDVDATTAAIAQHGGSILMEAGDVGPFGRMCIAADPAGAVFGVWQAGEHIGAELVNEPGGLTWEDLRSADPEAARAFYAGVFGYRYQPIEMAGPDYTTFADADDAPPLGGMGGMMGHDELPSHWLAYFAVASTADAVAAASANGGAVLSPAFDTPFGQMATLADPAGAVFMVVESGATEQPERSG